MRVYFIRHAIAVPHDAPGVVDDAARELTREGIAKMRRQVRGLAKLKVHLDRLYTSPLVRARQTADIVADELGMTGNIRTMPALGPVGNFDRMIEQLAAHPSLQDVGLVGHRPSLMEMATRLISGLGTPVLQMKKGGVACVEVADLHAPVRGELLWLLTPKQLRGLT